MTSGELVRLGRENIVHTYGCLADAMPDVTLVKGPGFLYCKRPEPLTLCNFAIGFDIAKSDLPAAMALLSQLGQANAAFRCFVMPGDQPADFGSRLEANGFGLIGSLDSLVAIQPTGATIELTECMTQEERHKVSLFMVTNFFWRREVSLRTRVMESTARSCHRLFWVGSPGQISGAVMISETEGALGLYNLCVDRHHRRRGLGRSIVQACLHMAASLGLPLVLQSESDLRGWYQAQGFTSFSRIETYGRRQSGKNVI